MGALENCALKQAAIAARLSEKPRHFKACAALRKCV
jgi:hypothetical protein